jgi:hypothetical protein
MHSTIPAPADSVGESTNQETPGARQRSVASIEYGTTGQLFDQIRDFLAQHPGLTTDAVLKLTHFIFAILFPECADIWPLASVVAPAGSEKIFQSVSALLFSGAGSLLRGRFLHQSLLRPAEEPAAARGLN